MVRSKSEPIRRLFIPALLILAARTALAQDYDTFSDWELDNYRHIQINILGDHPGYSNFQHAYKFILPLYMQFPESQAYRICYAQAVSGFPPSSENAPLHVHGLEALLGFPPEQFAESSFMGILLMNLTERLSEDRTLLTAAAARSDSVHIALLRVDGVAASIFATTLKVGTWHKVQPGSSDWTVRQGMSERRARLEAVTVKEKSQLPDWQAMERTEWIKEAGRALLVLRPVFLDARSYAPVAKAIAGAEAGARDSLLFTPPSPQGND